MTSKSKWTYLQMTWVWKSMFTILLFPPMWIKIRSQKTRYQTHHTGKSSVLCFRMSLHRGWYHLDLTRGFFGSHTRWGGKVDMSGKNMTIKSHSTTFRSVRPVLSFSFVFCKRVWDQSQTRLNSCPSSEWLTASSLPIETRAEVFPRSRSKIVNLECV